MQKYKVTLKIDAIKLRMKGFSYEEIKQKLGIPKGTLSGWLKEIKLSREAFDRIHKRKIDHLIQARKKAVVWHNSQKQLRLNIANDAAEKVLSKLNLNNSNIIELALSLLYLGEGRKTQPDTLLGNSDPLVLRFFIIVLTRIYKVPKEKIKADLHLRADQNPVQLRRYWSKTLGIPINNFTKTTFDKRTLGSSTHNWYKGVCVVRCGHSYIQKKLVSMSRQFCKKIIYAEGD